MKKLFKFRKFTSLYLQLFNISNCVSISLCLEVLIHRYTFLLHKNCGYSRCQAAVVVLISSMSLWGYHNCSIYLLDLFMNVQRYIYLFKITLATRYLDCLTTSDCFNSWFIHDLSEMLKSLWWCFFCPQLILAARHLVSFSIPESVISTDIRQNYSSLKVYHNVLLADHTCYKTHEQLKHSKQL